MTQNGRVDESNHGTDVVISQVSVEGMTNGQRERWMKGVRQNKIYDCLPYNTSYCLWTVNNYPEMPSACISNVIL